MIRLARTGWSSDNDRMLTALIILYSALTVLGAGVLVMDLFGVLDHAARGGQGSHDSGTGDAGSSAHLISGENAAPSRLSISGRQPDPGRAMLRVYGIIRNGVYFGLGTGAAGLFALGTGINPVSSLFWAGASGAFVMFLIRSIRGLARKELDSTIKDHEFLMDEARVVVPVLPGQMGKAAVSRYGKETEVYIRLRDPQLSASRGELVRIVDVEGECFTVEHEPE